MSVTEQPHASPILAFFGSARFTAAVSLAAIGSAFSVHLIRSLIGWPGLIGILCTLVLFCAVSLFARRDELEWHGLLPVSLLVFVAWCALTIVWSRYPGASVTGVLYQLAFFFIALYVGLVRDLIQIVRAVGDVMRVLLTLSLALEILSGVLLDLPIKFLDIEGTLAEGGPIQGIFGSRNMLGFVALVALVTFAVERATRSVQRGIGLYSITLAALLLLLSRSPVSLGVAAVAAVATAAALILRNVKPELRRILQLGMLIALIVGTITAYFLRSSILAFMGARAEFNFRLEIWNVLSRLIDFNQLNGWGWIGLWRPDISPFRALDFVGGSDTAHTSALNSFIDVYFQLGLVGLAIFVGMVGLALVRSWILATSKKSVIYLWPALMLIVLIATSMAESVLVAEFGWMLFVLCAVRAAHSLSWRQGLAFKR